MTGGFQQLVQVFEDHAVQLEACARDAIAGRGRLADVAREIQGGHASAEQKLSELFAKSDEIMKKHDDLFGKTDKGLLNLEKADLAIKEAMDARAVGLELEIKELKEKTSVPGGPPPGILGVSSNHAEEIRHLQERMVLTERQVLKVQDMINTAGTRLAAVEAAGGDSWAAGAEASRQRELMGPTPSAAAPTAHASAVGQSGSTAFAPERPLSSALGGSGPGMGQAGGAAGGEAGSGWPHGGMPGAMPAGMGMGYGGGAGVGQSWTAVAGCPYASVRPRSVEALPGRQGRTRGRIPVLGGACAGLDLKGEELCRGGLS